MPPLSLPADRPLYWVQPKALERRYVLIGGEGGQERRGGEEHRLEYASLQFTGRSLERAEAAVGEEGWVFQRLGPFSSKLTVRRRGEKTALAVYRLNLLGLEGRLEFAGGRTYRWQPANLGRVDYCYLDPQGQPLVTFHPGAPVRETANLFKTQYQVQVASAAFELAELRCGFGWFRCATRPPDRDWRLSMESIFNYLDAPLYWAQPKAFERRFVLRTGEHELAWLEFRSAFGSLALAEAAQGRWSFKRVGFLNPRVTVRLPDSEDDLAIYTPRWTGGGGGLEFPGGRAYVWQAANFWASQFCWRHMLGDDLVLFSPGSEEHTLSNLVKHQAQVILAAAARSLPDLPLLVLLGWYLMILQHDDAAATAAAAAAAA
jgi:hypothetical protein